MSNKYIIEVRDANGKLDSEAEKVKRKEHPFLFTSARRCSCQQKTFSMDELCSYMSFGQGRDKPSGPMELPQFMASIGISYRKKTW